MAAICKMARTREGPDLGCDGPKELDRVKNDLTCFLHDGRSHWRKPIRRPRRTHSPEFKAKVTGASLKEDKTLAELAVPGWCSARANLPPAARTRSRLCAQRLAS